MVLVVVTLGLVMVIETLRWGLRPEAKRLRMIKKIGGSR